MKTIYDLKLNEELGFDTNGFFTSVVRVPGGWIYRCFDKSHNIMSSVFVPYNNEFTNV